MEINQAFWNYMYKSENELCVSNSLLHTLTLQVLVALTNQGSGSTQQRTIPNLPFSDGTGIFIFRIISEELFVLLPHSS